MEGVSGGMSLLARASHVRRAIGASVYLQFPFLHVAPRLQVAVPCDLAVQQHAQHMLALVREAARHVTTRADRLVVLSTVSIHVDHLPHIRAPTCPERAGGVISAGVTQVGVLWVLEGGGAGRGGAGGRGEWEGGEVGVACWGQRGGCL